MLKGLKSLKEKFLLFKVSHQKDQKAFGEIYNMHRDRLYRFVFYKVPKPEDAEDITNDVFFKVWRFISTKGRSPEGRSAYGRSPEGGQNQGEISNLPAFLYRTARNSIVDYYREHNIPIVQMDNLENTEEISDSSEASKDLDIKLDADNLLNLIKSLKDEYREVLVMRYLDDMSPREIAQALGKNEGNVRVLVHRATEALKKRVGQNTMQDIS